MPIQALPTDDCRIFYLRETTAADISASQLLTLQCYQTLPESRFWEAWNVYTDPIVKRAVEELMEDRTYTTDCRDELKNAHGLSRVLDKQDRAIIFQRLVLLHENRLAEIHEQGKHTMAIAWTYSKEKGKNIEARDQRVIAACQATMEYLGDNFLNRKVEFVTEVYALLRKCDQIKADAVLNDLVAAYPWTGDVIVRNLRYGQVEYGNLNNFKRLT